MSVVGAEAWARAGEEASVESPGFGAEVEGAVGDDEGGVVAGVALGEGDGEGIGELSCSSMAIVAYMCFFGADGNTTVVGQCGGGVGIFKVVVDSDVVGTGDAGVESTVITGGAGSTRCVLVGGWCTTGV